MDNRASNKPPRFLTLEEYINLPPGSSKPYTSSPWVFNKEALTLDLYETTPKGERHLVYSVDLKRCTTPAQVLNSIMVNPIDVWKDDTRLASLVRGLSLYRPGVCYGQAITDTRATVKANMTEANILRGRRSGSTSRKDQENSASSERAL